MCFLSQEQEREAKNNPFQTVKQTLDCLRPHTFASSRFSEIPLILLGEKNSAAAKEESCNWIREAAMEETGRNIRQMWACDKNPFIGSKYGATVFALVLVSALRPLVQAWPRDRGLRRRRTPAHPLLCAGRRQGEKAKAVPDP